MKAQKFGTPLTRQEMKKIQGGDRTCNFGDYVHCSISGCVSWSPEGGASPALFCSNVYGESAAVNCYLDSECTTIDPNNG